VLNPSNQDRSVRVVDGTPPIGLSTLSGVDPDREIVFYVADGTSAAFALYMSTSRQEPIPGWSGSLFWDLWLSR
jgi:hypothetical protein